MGMMTNASLVKIILPSTTHSYH